MTQEQIQDFYNQNLVTVSPIRFDFINSTYKVGFFDIFPDTEELKKANQWRMIENNHAVDYQATKEIEFTTVINGNDLYKLSLSS